MTKYFHVIGSIAIYSTPKMKLHRNTCADYNDSIQPNFTAMNSNSFEIIRNFATV